MAARALVRTETHNRALMSTYAFTEQRRLLQTPISSVGPIFKYRRIFICPEVTVSRNGLKNLPKSLTDGFPGHHPARQAQGDRTSVGFGCASANAVRYMKW